MINESLKAVLPPVSDRLGDYATPDEARGAIMRLTTADLVKLRIVAEMHCRRFGIPASHLEPNDLLHEAFRRTLDCTKKWKNGVKLLYHLDRAMENIAGHEVPKLQRRVDIAGDGAEDEAWTEGEDPLDRLQRPRNAEGTVIASVQGREDLLRLEEVFHDDKPALSVLIARAHGQEGLEIQRSLNLSKKEYDSISKRILRKTKSYYEPKFPAPPPGRGA